MTGLEYVEFVRISVCMGSIYKAKEARKPPTRHVWGKQARPLKIDRLRGRFGHLDRRLGVPSRERCRRGWGQRR